MANVIEIESREREVIDVRTRSVDVVEIGYAGAGVAWGHIVGNMDDQADLKAAFDALWKYAKKNRKLAKAAM